LRSKEILWVPLKKAVAWLGSSRHLRLSAQAQPGKKEGKLIMMNLNQLSIIGFVGNHAETKYLPNGTDPVTFCTPSLHH
jgi:hypothetical protein